MPFEDAVPNRLVRWVSVSDPDWEAVYAEQLPRVYNFIRYRIGDCADVEDLTSATFEKAWRAAPLPTGPLGIHHLAADDRAERRDRLFPRTPAARAARRSCVRGGRRHAGRAAGAAIG